MAARPDVCQQLLRPSMICLEKAVKVPCSYRYCVLETPKLQPCACSKQVIDTYAISSPVPADSFGAARPLRPFVWLFWKPTLHTATASQLCRTSAQVNSHLALARAGCWTTGWRRRSGTACRGRGSCPGSAASWGRRSRCTATWRTARSAAPCRASSASASCCALTCASTACPTARPASGSGAACLTAAPRPRSSPPASGRGCLSTRPSSLRTALWGPVETTS